MNRRWAARAIFAVCIALGPASAPGSAWAEPPAEQLEAARARFVVALKFESDKEYLKALERFREVATVKTSPSVRYHIAFCEEQLGLFASAHEDYKLAEADAKALSAADVQRLALEGKGRVETRVAHLRVIVPPNVKGIEVRIDGSPVPGSVYSARTPMNPGVYRIEVGAPGYVTFEKRVPIAESEERDVEVPRLEPAKAKAPPTPSNDDPKPGGPMPEKLPAKAPDRDRSAAVIATVGTGLLFGGGLAAFLVAGSQRDDGAGRCALSTSPCDELKTIVRAWDTVALSAWIGAAALGAVSIVLWTQGPAKSATAISVSPHGATLGGSF